MNESAGGSAAVVALIEGVPTEALRQVCDAVQQRGLRVLHVTKTPTLTAAVRDLFDEQRICDTDDSDAILDALGQCEDAVVAVGTTDGFNVLVANAVALRLGLRAQPEDVVERCCHKGKTRELVGQADQLNPAWLAVEPHDPVPKSKMDAMIVTAGSVVVKPAGMCGGTFVSRHDTAREAVAAAEQIRQRCDETVVVEEYIDGPEFSVEVFGGHILGISRVVVREAGGFAEVGQVFPYDEDVNLCADLCVAARATLDALGLVEGPAHLQYRVSDGRCLLLEVNPRLPGGLICGLVKHALDLDLGALYVGFLLGSTEFRHVASYESPTIYAAGLFAMAESHVSGELTGWRGLEDARAKPGVESVSLVRVAGDRVSADGSNGDRLAYVIASAGSSAAALTNAQTALNDLQPMWQ